MTSPLYFDAAATTSLAPEVFAAMEPILRGAPGNASSSHWAGRQASQVLGRAREDVAALCSKRHAVIFTSGATESNNLAIFGLARSGVVRRFISVPTEHDAVLAPLRQLVLDGHDVRLLAVDSFGRPDLTELAHQLIPGALVTMMAANNETGAVNDLASIIKFTHREGGLVHTDASQVTAWGALGAPADADLITVSGHKMYGPQGSGALLVTNEVRSRLSPVVHGGGQERGLRPGTYNVAGGVGLAAASTLAMDRGAHYAKDIAVMRDKLWDGLRRAFPGAQRNGDPANCLPGTLNVSFAESGCPADAVLANLPDLAASNGSACSSGAPGPSHVLVAMGLTEGRMESSVRFSLPRGTTHDDVDRALHMIENAVRTVVGLSKSAVNDSRERMVQTT